jgi:hypothetical protein
LEREGIGERGEAIGKRREEGSPKTFQKKNRVPGTAPTPKKIPFPSPLAGNLPREARAHNTGPEINIGTGGHK